ncbi:AAA family ATPase [Devosia sp. A449]
MLFKVHANLGASEMMIMKPTRPLRPAADLPSDTRAIDTLFAEIYAEHADTIAAVVEDRAESIGSLSKPAPIDDDLHALLTGPTATLIKYLAVPAGPKDRMAHAKPYQRLMSPVPYVLRGNPGDHRKAMSARGSYRLPVIDLFLRDLASREVVKFKPTILVGPHGSGKTSLARDLCKELSLPHVVFPAAGVSDGMFGGSSSNWANTNPSVVCQILLQFQVANPLIIIDEADKATRGSHNGSLQDVLLNFLDAGNAAVFRDPSLEAIVDCSHVNWILTANDIDAIPAPLKDRCRIVRMPEPQWRHVGEVTRAILDDIATERDLDRRWLPELDPDEIYLIGKYWRGGSLRRLRRIVETMIDIRDEHMPSA